MFLNILLPGSFGQDLTAGRFPSAAPTLLPINRLLFVLARVNTRAETTALTERVNFREVR